MKYKTGNAFRQALETRLRNQSRQSGVPLVRLRKMVAFERFLACLIVEQPENWLLKGGLALQWRLGNRVRTTKDVDVLMMVPVERVHQLLVEAALLNMDDWFQFFIRQSDRQITEDFDSSLRFHVQALVDGRLFERFHIDVGSDDTVLEAADQLLAPPLLEFASIPPITVPCYPVTQHLAEKIHDYTRPRSSGTNSRVKDFVDILLLAETEAVQYVTLRQATLLTFEERNTHPAPVELPAPPDDWKKPFRKMAIEIGLARNMLSEATQAAQTFVNPALQDFDYDEWLPSEWRWR